MKFKANVRDSYKNIYKLYLSPKLRPKILHVFSPKLSLYQVTSERHYVSFAYIKLKFVIFRDFLF